MGGVYFTYMGRRNPLTDCARFFLGQRYPWRNHACQIWWRSLKGFRGSCGSNFSISHWLCWSSLQHSHTTVWACDYNNACMPLLTETSAFGLGRRCWSSLHCLSTLHLLVINRMQFFVSPIKFSIHCWTHQVHIGCRPAGRGWFLSHAVSVFFGNEGQVRMFWKTVPNDWSSNM